MYNLSSHSKSKLKSVTIKHSFHSAPVRSAWNIICSFLTSLLNELTQLSKFYQFFCFHFSFLNLI